MKNKLTNSHIRKQHIKYSNEMPPLSPEPQADEVIENYPQWELPKGMKMRLGKGAMGSIQFSQDGNLLAVSSAMGVWLYDVRTCKELSMLSEIRGPITFSPDGTILTNGSSFWNIADGRQLTIQNAPSDADVLHFSDDGRTLISFSSSKNTVTQLDIETGQSRVTEMEKRSGYTHLEKYALTDDKMAIGKNEGEVELWDTNTGKKLLTLREKTEKRVNFRIGVTEQNCAISLAFSPDGRKLTCGNLDGTVHVWDTISGVELVILNKRMDKMKGFFHTHDDKLAAVEPWEENNPGRPTTLTFSPDGNILAIGNINSAIQLWNMDTYDPIATFTGHISGVIRLAFSPDGTKLASGGSDGFVRFWSVETKKPLPTHIAGHAWVRGASFLNDSSTLASVSSNGILTVWDLKSFQKVSYKTKATLEELRSWNAYRRLLFSPDGSKLAASGLEDDSSKPDFDNYVLRLTDVRTGRESKVIPGGRVQVFSPDGEIIAGSGGNTIYMQNIETGDKSNIITAPEPDDDADMHTPDLNVFSFSPDGKQIVSGTSGGLVQIWDVETGKELTSYFEEQPPIDGSYEDPIRNLTFSSDGSLLAIGSMKKVRILGISDQTLIKEVTSSDPVYDDVLLFSPDNSVLIITLSKGRIQLLDVASGEILTTLHGHTASVESMFFSPDGKTLVRVAGGMIQFWDWEYLLANARGMDQQHDSEANISTKEQTSDNQLQFLVPSSHPAKSTDSILTLAEVYLANEWYEEALERYKRNLYISTSRMIPTPDDASEVITSPSLERKLFKQINKSINNVKDRDGFVNMLNQLIDLATDRPSNQLNAHMILAQFYGANGMINKAEEHIQNSKSILVNMHPENYESQINGNMALAKYYREIGSVEMSEDYIQETRSLIENLDVHPFNNKFGANFALSEFYREYGMINKADEYIRKTGLITEDAWMVLGPFDNAEGIGYDTAYIPEDITEIDLDVIYDGVNGPVRWKQFRDDELDGYIHLGEKDDNWHVGYAFTTVTSLDEREVQFRFDSDDQGKVWLNGKEVFSHTKAFMAIIDRYKIPVTLKPGRNSVLIKVCNEMGGWAFYLRITDKDGNPFNDLKFGQNI